MPETTTQSRDCTDVCSPVCIHTQQITDSCLDKDCIDDLRVYLTQSSQSALENASSVKIRYAELLYASVDTEPLAYKSGWYAVDVTWNDTTGRNNKYLLLSESEMYRDRQLIQYNPKSE